MQRCPICRARIKEGVHCYRCNADLTHLLQLDAEVTALEQQAVAQIALKNYSMAEKLCRQALQLQHRPLSRTLLGFIQHQKGNANHIA